MNEDVDNDEVPLFVDCSDTDEYGGHIERISPYVTVTTYPTVKPSD